MVFHPHLSGAYPLIKYPTIFTHYIYYRTKLCDHSYGSNTMVKDFVFADDAVILVESLEVLTMALEVLNKDAKPLGPGSLGPKPRYRCLEVC